ncbi:MAG: AAA family ATPase [Acidimicrobiales bacterium]
MVDIETSPFEFTGPVQPDDLIDRETELAALRDRAAHGRFVLLYAPRRYGKTSLIHALARDIGRGRDMAAVVADLEGVLTLADVARRLEDAYRRLPDGRFRKAMLRSATLLAELGIELSAGGVGVAATLRGRGPGEAAPVLERLLDLPWEAAERAGVRVLVVLDEFQAIADVAGADAVLRSKIQHQRDRVSYLFSGSEQGVLRAIFHDRAKPLYGQAEQIVLGPLPDEALAEFIVAKFAETGRDAGEALGLLLRAAEGHPQRAVFLAHHLWQATGPKGRADATTWSEGVERALKATGAEFTALTDGLTGVQRRVLRLLAHGEPLYGAAARRIEVAKSSATTAARFLAERSIAVRDGDSWRLLDPLLALWLRHTHPAP